MRAESTRDWTIIHFTLDRIFTCWAFQPISSTSHKFGRRENVKEGWNKQVNPSVVPEYCRHPSLPLLFLESFSGRTDAFEKLPSQVTLLLRVSSAIYLRPKNVLPLALRCRRLLRGGHF